MFYVLVASYLTHNSIFLNRVWTDRVINKTLNMTQTALPYLYDMAIWKFLFFIILKKN